MQTPSISQIKSLDREPLRCAARCWCADKHPLNWLKHRFCSKREDRRFTHTLLMSKSPPVCCKFDDPSCIALTRRQSNRSKVHVFGIHMCFGARTTGRSHFHQLIQSNTVST